jgi:hypothetical protein
MPKASLDSVLASSVSICKEIYKKMARNKIYKKMARNFVVRKEIRRILRYV